MTYPLALQLYTLRRVSNDQAELIRYAAEAGYVGVECVHDADTDVQSVKDALTEHGVKLVSAHVGLDFLENQLNEVLAFYKTLNTKVLVLPWLEERAYGDNKESWETLGKRFQTIAQDVQAEGMTLLYHNHSFEFGEYDGKLGLEYLLDNAPDLGLELDLGYCQEGGVDPYPLLEKYSGRLSHIHVKDRAAAGENIDQGGWADVGSGVIDLQPLLEAAKKAGAQWFIVEHDEPKNPLQSVKRSHTYLAGI